MKFRAPVERVIEKQIERPVYTAEASTFFECLFGPHRAEVLHKGTAYCRTCYDDKNRQGKLI